jgi:hypothetical protein
MTHNRAKLTNLGLVDFDSISLPQLRNMDYRDTILYDVIDNKNYDKNKDNMHEIPDFISEAISGIHNQGHTPKQIHTINQLTNGDVFAVVTNSGNYAKVQITVYGDDLGIRWITYPTSTYVGHALRNGVQLFSEVTRALDDAPEPHPFSFPPPLHPYIFKDITPDRSEGSGLVYVQVDSFSYYQDAAQPYVFYYLPDSFKIARKPDSPHTPIMSVKFESENSVRLAYSAMPYVDTKRLSNALEKLRHNPSFLTTQLPQGINSPLLQPLLIDPNKVKFYLRIPGQEDSPEPFQDRSKNALINITTGITDELALNLGDFQEIFNSIFGGHTLIFQGKVEVDVYTDKTETIPFIARINDLAGPILDYKEEQDSASGGVSATFVNAIESTVRINGLGAKIIRGNSSSRGEIRGLNLPFQLKPGESIQFIVSPLEQLSENGQTRAVFDSFSLVVQPDTSAIWDSIVDKSVPSKPREVIIKTPVFRDPGASKDLLEFIVEFKCGRTVELTPTQDTVNTTLPLTPDDLRNLVLGNSDRNMYVYNITAVGKDGHLTRSPDKTLVGDTIIVLGVN